VENNLYEVGGKVGNSNDFIGREKIFDLICQRFFCQHPANCSIYGLEGVGKSSLVDQLIQANDNLENSFIINECVTNSGNAWELYCLIFDKIKEQIEQKKLGTKFDMLIDKINSFIADTTISDSPLFVRKVSKILDEVVLCNYKILLVLDNFDKIANVFEFKEISQLLDFIKSPSSGIKILAVSKRNINEIQPNKGIEKIHIDSVFKGAFAVYTILRGYDDAELDSLFENFKNKGYSIDKEIRNNIITYFGRIPAILSRCLNGFINGGKSAESIYIEEESAFTNIYKSWKTFFKEINLLVPYYQLLMIPEQKSDVHELENRGLISKSLDGKSLNYTLGQFFNDYFINSIENEITDSYLAHIKFAELHSTQDERNELCKNFIGEANYSKLVKLPKIINSIGSGEYIYSNSAKNISECYGLVGNQIMSIEMFLKYILSKSTLPLILKNQTSIILKKHTFDEIQGLQGFMLGDCIKNVANNSTVLLEPKYQLNSIFLPKGDGKVGSLTWDFSNKIRNVYNHANPLPPEKLDEVRKITKKFLCACIEQCKQYM
jgi:hypothetical protein